VRLTHYHSRKKTRKGKPGFRRCTQALHQWSPPKNEKKEKGKAFILGREGEAKAVLRERILCEKEEGEKMVKPLAKEGLPQCRTSRKRADILEGGRLTGNQV